ncbi:nucleoside triphosphate pyrophosphohydrolase [Candidatus Pacearchaeota archaeon]|nr:nucleoside triphosphate pyrophosphohydrolase [Candidatus Pacearchaeota archaeon]
MKYNKLIRDKIPEIIKSKGDSCKVHAAGEEEYWDKLKTKIGEEVDEFLKNPCVEELADIQEVINAISDFKFEGKSKLEEIRKKKFEERGGFEKRLILEEADDR